MRCWSPNGWRALQSGVLIADPPARWGAFAEERRGVAPPVRCPPACIGVPSRVAPLGHRRACASLVASLAAVVCELALERITRSSYPPAHRHSPSNESRVLPLDPTAPFHIDAHTHFPLRCARAMRCDERRVVARLRRRTGADAKRSSSPLEPSGCPRIPSIAMHCRRRGRVASTSRAWPNGSSSPTRGNSGRATTKRS
jgi:hypothetical protein